MLKCTETDFFSGSASDPAGKLTPLPDPLLDLRGPISQGGEKGRGLSPTKKFLTPPLDECN